VKLLRALFADVGLMGLAVVFAWAIWYTVREDLNETQKRPVEVVFQTDADLDVTPRTQTVTLLFQGPRRAIDALRTMSAPRIVRHLTPADLPADAAETRRDFGKDDFDFADSLDGNALTVLDMVPPVVSVKLYRVATRGVTVAPPEFPGAADLGLKHVLKGWTDRATIRGRASDFGNFREIRTVISKEQLQAFAESLKDSPKTTASLVLEIDPSQRELFTLIEPKQLVASVELSRVAEQEFVVPIQIYDAAQKGARPARRLHFAELNKPHFVPGDPPRVKLQVTGVPSALAAMTASKVHAFVLGADLADDQRNGDVPVHVADLPPGVALSQDYTVDIEESR
jgi:hypothetical protein